MIRTGGLVLHKLVALASDTDAVGVETFSFFALSQWQAEFGRFGSVRSVVVVLL
jgi:hypothetical protein